MWGRPRYPLGRTSDEIHIFLDLHPCACGSARFDRRNALLDDGRSLMSIVEGDCFGCAGLRSYVFRLSEAPHVGDNRFGAGTSELLDAGEWIYVADAMAAVIPESPPRDPDERALARNRLTAAHDAIEQALRFARGRSIPVPAQSSVIARQLLPSRFDPARLREQQEHYETALLGYREALNA